MNLLIYPPPKSIKAGKKRLSAGRRGHLRLSCDHSEFFLDAVKRFVGKCPQPMTLTYGQVEPELTLISVFLDKSIKGEESYRISTTNDGFLLTAGTEVGLFRGLATLQQVCSQQEIDLPYLQIEDTPDFKDRGVMLDISRCKVPELDTLKALIDSFATLKYNQLQLYTEHTFAFTNHSLVWADASPYTAADILEIQSYCNARYIELVPNLNCFGHFERWLKYPEYHAYAECPEGFVHPLNGQQIPFGSTLKPNRKSLQLLDELHAEYLPLFESGRFNVGGDEPWELGRGFSKSRCEAQGTTSVYLDFIHKIKQLVKKRGRRMMFWSDIVLSQPDSLKKLSRDLIALNWGYEANHPFHRECRLMADQQVPFYVCPGTSAWNSLTGRMTNATKNLANAAKNGIQYDAEGFLVTDWGDHGHHHYLPVSYAGFAIGACESWNHRGSKLIDAEDLINRVYFREHNAATAKILVRMGKALDLAPSPIRNESIFNQLLFWDQKHEPKVTQRISDSELNDCISEFQDIKSTLHMIRTTDRDRLIPELNNAMDMAVHGIQRLQVLRSGGSAPSQLRLDMQNIIGQHEKIWLKRNRPGGLAESTAYLKRSLDRLS